MPKAIFCIALSEAQAESIVNQLKDAGFSTMTSPFCFQIRRARGILPTNNIPAPEGAATGRAREAWSEGRSGGWRESARWQFRESALSSRLGP